MRSFKKYIRISRLPLLFGSAAGTVWYFLPREKLGITMGDIDEFNILLQFLGLSHGILATGVLTSVWNKNDRLLSAIRCGNKESFLESRDTRIHGAVHFLLFVFSAFVTAVVLCMPARSILVGCATAFLSVFIVTLWWQVAKELDDPLKGQWILDAPTDWTNHKRTKQNNASQ